MVCFWFPADFAENADFLLDRRLQVARPIIFSAKFAKFAGDYLQKMQRKFLTNLLFLIFVNVLIKPFYIFGIDRTVQVTVGTADYGLYAVLYNFSILYTDCKFQK